MNRIITILVEITDPKEAEWIWAAHMNGPLHGINVNGISNGNMFDEVDKLNDEINGLEEKLDKYHL